MAFKQSMLPLHVKVIAWTKNKPKHRCIQYWNHINSTKTMTQNERWTIKNLAIFLKGFYFFFMTMQPNSKKNKNGKSITRFKGQPKICPINTPLNYKEVDQMNKKWKEIRLRLAHFAKTNNVPSTFWGPYIKGIAKNFNLDVHFEAFCPTLVKHIVRMILLHNFHTNSFEDMNEHPY